MHAWNNRESDCSASNYSAVHTIPGPYVKLAEKQLQVPIFASVFMSMIIMVPVFCNSIPYALRLIIIIIVPNFYGVMLPTVYVTISCMTVFLCILIV